MEEPPGNRFDGETTMPPTAYRDVEISTRLPGETVCPGALLGFQFGDPLFQGRDAIGKTGILGHHRENFRPEVMGPQQIVKQYLNRLGLLVWVGIAFGKANLDAKRGIGRGGFAGKLEKIRLRGGFSRWGSGNSGPGELGLELLEGKGAEFLRRFEQ